MYKNRSIQPVSWTKNRPLQPTQRTTHGGVLLVVAYHPHTFLILKGIYSQKISSNNWYTWTIRPWNSIACFCGVLPPSWSQNLLVRAVILPQKELYKGNCHCNHLWCTTCVHILTGRMFKSTAVFRKHSELQIKATADCNTKNLVYLIECKNAPCSTLERQRIISKYAWWAISWKLNITTWKKQWLDASN